MGMTIGMGRGKLAVGLDIGSSSVKLVQLKEKRGGYRCRRSAPPGSPRRRSSTARS
jgi:Tfp pilus assembly PilM family ATPase